MNGKENIIAKILSDSDEKCKAILADAQKEAQEIAQNAQEFVAEQQQRLQERLDGVFEERSRNYLATAKLDAGKYKLAQKQQLLADCYNKAMDALVALPNDKKLAFIGKLLQNFAEDGETVQIIKADSGLITQAFLDGFGKNLKLSPTHIDARGGIVLQGVGYQKDLTLATVASYVREQTEGEVAKILFGD